jgi:hypothetical protein
MYLHNRNFRRVAARRPVRLRRYPIAVRPTYTNGFQGLGMPAAELAKKLKLLSLLPHKVESGGADVALTPAVMDPKIYDGPEKYLVDNTKPLQGCLNTVMQRREFQGIKAALVDMTKGVTKPVFAGFNHKSQVFAASVPKIATLVAAFQLRQDLRVALKQKTPKPSTLTDLFNVMRDDWAATQVRGTTAPFTRGVSLSGKLVIVGGAPVWLGGPTIPQLDHVFADVATGSPVTVNFRSTGESKADLQKLVNDYNLKDEEAEVKAAKAQFDAAKTVAERRTALTRLNEAQRKLIQARDVTKRPPARLKIKALGFLERLGIAVGGDVPASNYATSTVVHDIGYPFIASVLLQTGLYDTNRNGGLWLGADYFSSDWRGALAGGLSQSTTAGAVAAYYTLLRQHVLVSPSASIDMKTFLQKAPSLRFPGTGSWFHQGLLQLQNSGSIKTVLAKVGLAGGADDCALIEREVDAGGGKKVRLCYVAVALRASGGAVLEQLIREFDKCILINNGLTPTQGGHTP